MTISLLLAALVAGADSKPDAAALGFFENKIRPVLVDKCLSCHSEEAKKNRGGLLLDSRAALLKGGDNGPAVVVGKPEQSLLIKALRHADTLKMPPKEKLADTVVADFEKWIRDGLADPRGTTTVKVSNTDLEAGRKHWAFQPVTKPALPTVKHAAWGRQPIDRFVLARLEAKGLRPAEAAAPSTLLRRLCFDLTGLPPSPEMVTAFDRNQIEATVDRLLAAPTFGEHWARHWLDGVRYNATLPGISHYRDWVVGAFNADLPYDQFLTRQLCGDLLGGEGAAGDDNRIAAQLLTLNAREMDPIEGMVEVVGQQILGLSLNCAKCHDHKFEPLYQTDYYALAGIFTSTQMSGGKNPGLEGTALPSRGGAKISTLVEGKIVGDTPLLVRGERDKRGALVPRRFPVVLAGEKQTPLGQITRTSGRRELAGWLTDGKNPLTARVFVNRVWQHLLGQPIVGTPNDFGLNGDAATHPELLDYLAAQFVEQKWSVKKLVREIVLSQTYQQSSRTTAEVRQADPENQLLARANLKRMTYEQILDNLLAVSGELREGPPKFEAGKKAPVGGLRFGGKEPMPCRTLYLEDPTLARQFDGADPELLVDLRDASVTAPQMLFFLNNPYIHELAGKAAGRVEKAANGDVNEKVRFAYRLMLGREAGDAEVSEGVTFLRKHGTTQFCHLLLCGSEFIYLN